MSSTQQLLLGEGAGGAIPAYIEEVFSTWLYTGTGSAQTITNGIDFSTKGGLLWFKARNDTRNNWLYDSTRSIANGLRSDSTAAETSTPDALTAFNNNGFSIGTSGNINTAGNTLVSWSFRKQPKFFDVLTWTGDGTNNRLINHSLGSTPGAIIIKRTDTTANWVFYHRSLFGYGLFLNTTAAEVSANSDNGFVSNTTDTQFQVTYGAVSADNVNASGGTYVAYLFAHNAGGFGLTGSDNVISCGSVTTDGSGNATADLGYEPQWVLIKQTNASGQNWILQDNMRGVFATGNNGRILNPNTTAAETSAGGPILLTSTGFKLNAYVTSSTVIYIAIRRGPMKVPTDATKVFKPFYASYSEGAAITTDFPLDLSMWKANTTYNWSWQDRLRGWPTTSGAGGPALASNTSTAETTAYQNVGAAKFDSNTGAVVSYQADSGRSNEAAYFMFRRAPGFFDEVCYTGTGTAGQTFNHNLGVVPEMMIVKGRSIAEEWNVYFGVNTKYIVLNQASVAETATTRWNDTSPTSSVFSLGTSNWVNGSGSTYVAWLFATCAGVSKVGSYTGNGSTQTINCGFTGGSRFVMIKQTSGSGGDWIVFSTAMGIVAGTDRTALFNSGNATTTFGDTLDADNVGFELGPNSALFSINTSSETYIFLAIA